MKHTIALLLLTVLFTFELSAKVYDMVVAQDGTGDYISLTTALERMGATKRVIFIKNGVYEEKLEIIGTYKNVSLIGESREGVIIKFNDYAGKSSTSSTTAQSFTFKIEGAGFYAENITFQNTATQAQAVAIYTKADTIVFKNCSFLGYQDTHFADNGRQYFLNCTIKGDVDFIFGNAAAIFDRCTIISSKRKGGYVTAPAEAIYKSGSVLHGFLFRECKIVPEEGLGDNTCYLGRPWGDYASSVYLNCRIGSHIKPEGWSVWTTDQSSADANNHESSIFAEFNSKDVTGNTLDISGRVDWSSQLSSDDTSAYAIQTFFHGWTPYHKTTAPSPPSNVFGANNTIYWSAVDDARGYVILRNDSVVAFAEETSFAIGTDYSINDFGIRTVGKYGALSAIVDLPTSSVNTLLNRKPGIYLKYDRLIVPENQYTRIIGISGKQVMKSVNSTSIDVGSLPDGIYIVELVTRADEHMVEKIFINSSYRH